MNVKLTCAVSETQLYLSQYYVIIDVYKRQTLGYTEIAICKVLLGLSSYHRHSEHHGTTFACPPLNVSIKLSLICYFRPQIWIQDTKIYKVHIFSLMKKSIVTQYIYTRFSNKFYYIINLAILTGSSWV